MRFEIYSADKNEILNIGAIGFGDDIRITHFGPGQRKVYIVHYVLSGQGRFNNSVVKAGQGFLIYPNMYEHYYADKKNPWSFLWIISEDEKMGAVFEKYNADKKTNIFDYDDTKTLGIMKSFIINNSNRNFDSLRMTEYFLHILNSAKKTGQKSKNSSDMYYDYAKEYIKSNIYKPLKVNEITKILGITQPYLYKIFTLKSGMSPKKYISVTKIEEAKRLLKTTSLTINEVAFSVGYEDVTDFFKFFRKMSGITPTQYRNGCL